MKRGGNRRSDGLTGDMGTLRSVLVATAGQAKLRELYQLLKPAEAAEFLGVSLSFVQHATGRGELLCVRIGKGDPRYRVIDLIAFSNTSSAAPRV